MATAQYTSQTEAPALLAPRSTPRSTIADSLRYATKFTILQVVALRQLIGATTLCGELAGRRASIPRNSKRDAISDNDLEYFVSNLVKTPLLKIVLSGNDYQCGRDRNR